MATKKQNKISVENESKFPYVNAQAEKNILSILISNNEQIEPVKANISPEDFVLDTHRHIYTTILHLDNNSKSFSLINIIEQFKSSKLFSSVEDEAYLFELAKNVQSIDNLLHYINALKQNATLNKLFALNTKLSRLFNSQNSENISNLVKNIQSAIDETLDSIKTNFIPECIKKSLVRVVDKIDSQFQEDNMSGIPTGFTDLDYMTGGLQAGELSLIAARTGMGKTSFAIDICGYIAIKRDIPVLFFTMESSANNLTSKVMSSIGGLNNFKLKNGLLTDDDWPLITTSVSILSDAKIFIDDTPALTPEQIAYRSKKFIRKNLTFRTTVANFYN